MEKPPSKRAGRRFESCRGYWSVSTQSQRPPGWRGHPSGMASASRDHVTSVAELTSRGDHAAMRDLEGARASASRARHWSHIAGVGLAVTALALEIAAIAVTESEGCVYGFSPRELVAVFAIGLSCVVLLTLIGSLLAAAIPRGERRGETRRWDPAGVGIAVAGLVVNLPLLWYAAIYLPTTHPCPGFGF
jgi:hypothetical protein